MSKITKEECLKILNDMKEIVSEWEWEEDYYSSGCESRDERISWTRDRLNRIIEIVEEDQSF